MRNADKVYSYTYPIEDTVWGSLNLSAQQLAGIDHARTKTLVV